MQITETEIFSFGKFHKQKFAFAPGINVIYGENEAGKSTLHAFLLAMLFGLEKGRGRSVASEGYQRYEPWHAPAYYSGVIRFEVGGKPFYLERNFYHKEKRDFLRNESDGEELSVAYGDLTMLLGGIPKDTFSNTYDIAQSGAVTGKELSEILTEYLSDASESGGASFHVARAVDKLKDKRKKLNVQLKEAQEEKTKRVAELQMEQAILQKDLIKLREDVALAEKKKDINMIRMQAERQGQRLKRKLFLSGLFIVCAVACTVMSQMFSLGKELFLGGAAASLILGIVTFLLAVMKKERVVDDKDSAVYDKKAASEAIETDERIGIASADAQLLSLLYENVGEKETRLYNISEQLDALQLDTAKERELKLEIDAVIMAQEEIQMLAKEISEEAGDSLNEEVSRYISSITEGKYDSVRVDENGKLWVLVDGKEVSPEILSRGTLEQFYLALRLAVGRTVTSEEVMPIFLDDAFVLYDDKRLEQTLNVLSKMNEQIFLFTCQRREALSLTDMGVTYNLIELG